MDGTKVGWAVMSHDATLAVVVAHARPVDDPREETMVREEVNGASAPLR